MHNTITISPTRVLFGVGALALVLTACDGGGGQVNNDASIVDAPPGVCEGLDRAQCLANPDCSGGCGFGPCGCTCPEISPGVLMCGCTDCLESCFPDYIGCVPKRTECGTTTCDAASEICVIDPAGPGFLYRCAAVPPGCENDRTCACASGLCSDVTNCVDSGPENTLTCDCPQCA